MAAQNTYKYRFEVNGITVISGITTDLEREEQELRKMGVYTMFKKTKLHWSEGRIVQVGDIDTYNNALEWEYNNTINTY